MSLDKFRTKNFFRTMKIKDFNYKNNSFHEIVANRIDKMIKLH